MNINSMIYSGSWYPEELNSLNSLIARASQKLGLTVKSPSAAVLPHAGLIYSARGMLPFFQAITSPKKLLVILSPSHYYHLENNSVYYGEFDYYQTPFGNLKAASTDFFIGKSEKFCEFSDPIVEEHGIELFLPMAAKFLGTEIAVASFLCGKVTDLEVVTENVELLLEYIESICGFDEVVLIASSDFTHYGKRFNFTPYDEQEAETCVKEKDLEIARLFAEASVEHVVKRLDEQDHTICGVNAAVVLKIIMEKKGVSGVVSDYYNSNDITNKKDESFVSYCPIIFSKQI
ncbi:MAG: AmmeMemoRadiSam system protein B [Spirochaetales bacterium]|nr:AmmeMemoRadiSam system protein B [Spirochaetales bacterium]